MRQHEGRRGWRWIRGVALLCWVLHASPAALADPGILLAGSHGPHAPMLPAWCAEPFEVRLRPLTVQEDDATPMAALGGDSGAALSMQGVTLGQVDARSLVEGLAVTTRQGCQAYRLTVGYEFVAMSIARELRGHSCAYEHVRNHELRHVAIYRDWLATLDTRVLAALHERFAEHPFQGRTEQASAAVALALQSVRGVLALQHEFDSDAEYARNAQVCNHEIAALGLRELARIGH